MLYYLKFRHTRNFLAMTKRRVAAKSDEVLTNFDDVLGIRKQESLDSLGGQARAMYIPP